MHRLIEPKPAHGPKRFAPARGRTPGRLPCPRGPLGDVPEMPESVAHLLGVRRNSEVPSRPDLNPPRQGADNA